MVHLSPEGGLRAWESKRNKELPHAIEALSVNYKQSQDMLCFKKKLHDFWSP